MASETSITTVPDNFAIPPAAEQTQAQADLEVFAPGQFHVIRRNGKVAHFDSNKISVAMTKAFLAVEGGNAAASGRIHDTVRELTDQVVKALTRRVSGGGTVHIEDIQDQVELALMRAGEHKVARSYVLYREERARARAKEVAETSPKQEQHLISVKLPDGSTRPLDMARLRRLVEEASRGLEAVNAQAVLDDAHRNLFDGVKEEDVSQALVMSARALIEQEPDHTYAAARLLLDVLRQEALNFLGMDAAVNTHADMAERYPDYFKAYVKRGADLELLDRRLTQYDLNRLGAALKPERDLQFTYLGLQTLYDRYFIHSADAVRFELPQAFFMRVAMGLATNEIDREERAIEFYELLSSFDFMCSTPTLFNSGTLRPQLSSCYLTSVPDDLDGIYSAIKDNALLSKFAGGLGNDWTRVRGMGAHIKGTNGKSQGVVPFLKVANDTAVAVNQCFAPETTVFTAEGPKAIAAVRAGDLVLSHRGQYREVLQRLPHIQQDAMVELEINHTLRPLRVTDGHPLWTIKNSSQAQLTSDDLAPIKNERPTPNWCEAGQLEPGDYVAQVIPKEIVPVEDFTEEDARFFGILLAGGHRQGNRQWNLTGDPARGHLRFVKRYLAERKMHYWETRYSESVATLHWNICRIMVRDATSGQLIGRGAPTMPFDYADLFDNAGRKRIGRRLSHLPHDQTRAVLQGLLETGGALGLWGQSLRFTCASEALAEGVRYQCLRLGVPVAGAYCENDAVGTESVGAIWELSLPAVPELGFPAANEGSHARDWFEHNGQLFTQIKSLTPIQPVPVVYDLKVEGDETYMTTAALVHNGGKRKGAVCAYLETWHIDIEEFLELRKNTGDDRRRTHDMNTANWIPDLFMKRVAEDADWTLLSPDEATELHDLNGAAFEEAYTAYEGKARRGELKVSKTVKAVDLWRKMLGMLFETGHPWLAFKDPCNLRYTNQHIGVVHSSNLCTEITLHTNDQEIAVCNLGSVNLAAHVAANGLDMVKLEQTVSTAMRMLDNVIDYNYYSVPQARRSNLRHRPVGLGVMGFQDALYKLRLAYASTKAVDFADYAMEAVSYYAIHASTDLAVERGRYSSYEGSLWSQGILPIDSLALLQEGRGSYLEIDNGHTMDWDRLRQRVNSVGMRNSNCMAIAPTATISNICGVSQSIEPTYQNLFVKSNLSGEFTIVNPYLVQDLKDQGLWDEVMVNDLKYYDGSVQPIDRIPQELKDLYATAFEIDPRWLVEAGSRRQKWLDQAQSLNLYMAEPDGKKLDNLYKLAWVRGLKTTYYLRSMGATHVEKSTMDDARRANTLNAVGGTYLSVESSGGSAEGPEACAVLNPDCEACQ